MSDPNEDKFWEAIIAIGKERGKEKMLEFLAECLMAGTAALGGGETTYTNDTAKVVVTVPADWCQSA